MAGRPGGEQDLDDRVWGLLGQAPLHLGGGAGAHQLGQRGGAPAAGGAAAGGGHLTVANDRDPGCVRVAVVGEDQARVGQLDDRAELGVVAALQRVGDADRRDGDADGVRREREQQVLDRVAGQDHQGTLAELPVEQALPDRVGRCPRLRVADNPPAVTVALAGKHALRVSGGPNAKHLRNARRMRRQRGLRPEHDGAIAAPAQRHRRRREQLRFCVRHRLTPPARHPTPSHTCWSATVMADAEQNLTSRVGGGHRRDFQRATHRPRTPARVPSKDASGMDVHLVTAAGVEQRPVEELQTLLRHRARATQPGSQPRHRVA
jgi:hypothetical protein